VSTNLICPDCGGVIGSAEPGVAVCTCFAKPEESFDVGEHSSERSLSDTEAVAELTKRCFKCGANVAGHRRFKDSRGYLCVECNRKEMEAEKEGTAACAECGRRVKPTGLVEFRGLMICKLCKNDHTDAERKKVKLVSSKNFDEQEKKSVKTLAILLGILAVLMIVGWFKMRHG
jgi:DNA-directed RNA polymerase subunit RPC12/RpoP